MVTVEKLRELGANVDEGLARCLNKEDFYLKLVGMVLADDGYERLQAAIDAGDYQEAFERAHSLKGIVGNVSLTNLLAPIEEMTEELRNREERDYSGQLTEMFTELEKLRAL